MHMVMEVFMFLLIAKRVVRRIGMEECIIIMIMENGMLGKKILCVQTILGIIKKLRKNGKKKAKLTKNF